MVYAPIKRISAAGRVFAVGDIHGCAEHLDVMLDYLQRQRGLNDADCVVFVGDYIDRGPNSKKVVESLIDFKGRFPNSQFLMGNHEDMLLHFLYREGKSRMVVPSDWCYNGMEETLKSYGLGSIYEMNNVTKTIELALGHEHLKFFRSLIPMLVIDEYVFVHAGVRPMFDISEQSYDDVFWIREEFIQRPEQLRDPDGNSYIVVYGHTMGKKISFDLPHKIGIDCGTFMGEEPWVKHSLDISEDNRRFLGCVNLTEGETYHVHPDMDILVESF